MDSFLLKKGGLHYGSIDNSPHSRCFTVICLFSIFLSLRCARGYEGQNVIVIPSRKMVLVHLAACNSPSGPGAWNPEEFVGDVLKAFQE
jgi:hypothetical protein